MSVERKKVPQPPNCMRCLHFFVTYEPARPRGCRAYGFKSLAIPSQVVLTTSGSPCQLFSPRGAA